MKTPTRMQRFFALAWIGRIVQIWCLGIPLFLVFIEGRICLTFLDPLDHWWDFVCFVWYLVIAFILGFFLALVLGSLIVGSMFYFRGRKNGGPFKVGDTVQILTGQHKGHITRVYSMWQVGSVRVELGENERNEFKDVFSFFELLKEDDTEQ